MAEQSLAHSVAWRVEQFRKQSGVSVELAVAPAWDEASLSPAARAHILGAVDEALANIRKHAAARNIRVNLAVESGQAVMRVEDDGAGFLLCRLVGKLLRPTQQRSGLCRLRDRTRALGGTFEIASSPGKGTRIGVKIPLRPISNGHRVGRVINSLHLFLTTRLTQLKGVISSEANNLLACYGDSLRHARNTRAPFGMTYSPYALLPPRAPRISAISTLRTQRTLR